MSDEIVRDQSEIDEVVNKCHDIINNNGTEYHGMSYEEGLKDMYEWLTGQTNDNPLEL